MADEIKDEWSRFFAHWSATTLGCFLRTLIPLLIRLQNPQVPLDFPRWWVALILAAIYALVGGIINSNLPAKPREFLKSVLMGFALDSAAFLTKITPVPGHF